LRLDADVATLSGVFDEIAQGALHCRFRDCRHQGEPGCAVREQVAPERLRNFHKMARELQRDAMSALQRKEQRQQWKSRHRAVHARDRDKRGDGP
jgi:ribosome biogenesis GTPase